MTILEIIEEMRRCVAANSVTNIPLKTLPPIFRGDRIDHVKFPIEDWRHKGESYPQLMLSEGVLCKFESAHARLSILNEPLLYLICSHIGYDTPNSEGVEISPEVRIAKHSPLISFSDKRDFADDFADRSKKAKLTTCNYENATHFVFRISGLKGYEYEPGWYFFAYKPSSSNMRGLNNARIDRGVQEMASGGSLQNLNQAIGEMMALNNLDAANSIVIATAIDAARYLEGADRTKVDSGLFQRALERAKKWNEWLIYPGVPGTVDGHAQRLYPCEHLGFEYYARDTRRD